MLNNDVNQNLVPQLPNFLSFFSSELRPAGFRQLRNPRPTCGRHCSLTSDSFVTGVLLRETHRGADHSELGWLPLFLLAAVVAFPVLALAPPECS